MEIHDEHSYRKAIAELHTLGNPESGTPADQHRQALIAAIESFAQKAYPQSSKGRPDRSIPTRGH